MNTALLITIAVVSISYIGYIVLMYGIQPSISASYNNLEGPVKKSLYSWFIFGVGLPMMILSDNTWGVIAGMFLLLDFACTTGGDKLNQFLHNLGAQGGMFLGTLMLGFAFGQWWLAGITAGLVAVIYFTNNYVAEVRFAVKGKKYLWNPKNGTWWLEVVVLGAVWFGLMIEKVI